VTDAIANAALYFGAVHTLSREETPPERRLSFLAAKANFYAAAREGLDAAVEWLDGRTAPLAQVLREEVLPRARRGLLDMGIDPEEADLWLGVVAERLRTRRTGAAWQRAFVARHGPDMQALTAAYLERQQSGRPVHEWTL
jgi:hypothetical protein